MGVVVWNIWIIFPFSWEFDYPNWLIFFRGVGWNHQPDMITIYEPLLSVFFKHIVAIYGNPYGSWTICWWFPWWFPQKTMLTFTDRDDPLPGAFPPGPTGASPSALATTPTSWTSWKIRVGRQLKWGATLKILVGGLEHLDYFSIYREFDYPNWLSYFWEVLKPPTSYL